MTVTFRKKFDCKAPNRSNQKIYSLFKEFKGKFLLDIFLKILIKKYKC